MEREGRMRKILLILGLVLLLQLVWVSTTAAAPPQAGGFWHMVRYGETLHSIGRWYGVSPYAICHANGLGNCNYIWAGQRLWIPSGPSYPREGYRPYVPYHRAGSWGYDRCYWVSPRPYYSYHPYSCGGHSFCNPW
jgi:hypothetical protein